MKAKAIRGGIRGRGQKKSGAGRKRRVIKRESVAELPFEERLNVLQYGAAAHLEQVCRAMLEVRLLKAGPIPDSPVGKRRAENLRYLREFLGDWLAMASPEDLRAMLAWRDRPNPAEPVDAIGFRLAQMAFTQGEIQPAPPGHVGSEEPADYLVRVPLKKAHDWVTRRGFEASPEAVRKAIGSLGAKRPRGRPPGKRT